MSIATSNQNTIEIPTHFDRNIDTADQDIVANAYECLERHLHFRGRSRVLQVYCRQKVLTVKGRLPTFYLKQLLQVALIKLDGVFAINNEVIVINPEDTLCNFDADSTSENWR